MEPSSRRLAATLLALALLAAACGHKGPPSPPQEIRPEAVKDLRVRQRGDRIILSLAEPKARTDGSPLEEPTVLRLEQVTPPEPAAGKAKGRKRPRGEAREVSAWVVPKDRWGEYKSKGRLQIPIAISSLAPPEPRAGASPGARRVAFVAEVQEGRRKRGARAGPVVLTLCEAPAAPRSVAARPAPGGVLVSWENGDAKPAGVLVYRAEGTERFEERPSRELPAGAESFLDESVKMGATYRYQVRLGAGEQAQRCESEPGSAEVTAVDIFAPAPPQGLAAAAESSLIRLFWTPSPEPDLAGYNVYRKEGDAEEYRLLTPAPITETTYADTDVKRGVTYTYAVSAVDQAASPNESERSAPARDALP